MVGKEPGWWCGYGGGGRNEDGAEPNDGGGRRHVASAIKELLVEVDIELLEALHTKVIDRMNARLLQMFQASKVEKALKQMHPMKASGPDGAAPPKFHETLIVLVPKTKNPERVTNYRPIKLCNVAYKLASKVVANKLKLVLQDIIYENQSAFVSERLITNNVLMAHEIMNHISRKRKGKCGEMALKLDMSKAYDRVEWSCLQQIMAKLGFHKDWIRLVMRCVSPVTYAELKGIAASARGPRISHLFFADDSLIFERATVKECLEIQRVLQVYEESSGQQLNRNKTSLFFSHNTANGVKETIKAMFGAQVIKQHESYLGLPSLVGRLKRNIFAQLKLRVSNKLAGWKEKLLSNAGKEVLIKAVAQAVPSYTMSYFKLPNSLCDELTRMDVEDILSIPLSAQGGIDRMIWLETKNGKFIVRSAYELAQIIQSDDNITESSDPTALKQTWRCLWDMNVPNKIKHFAWKACKNILATKENLQKRSITKDSICDSCGKASKSTCHLFWLCDKAKETWSSSKLVIPFKVSPQWKFMDVMWHLQRWTELYPGLVERAIAICWGIWKDRNTVRHGGKRKKGKAIVRSSLKVLEEFQAANVQPVTRTRQPSNVTKWRPPQPGHYKINVDGAIFSNKKQVGIGVIIRDLVGLVIAALSRKLALPLRVLETKAKAMEIGVQFALDVGVRDVTLKGDSLCICNALQGLCKTSSSVHNIIARSSTLQKALGMLFFHIQKGWQMCRPICWPNMQLI
ncbi:uncharacterized protein LOC142634090 [Castanea sativa]|uniref:uncharacterized protein LOC142634090 n=1 Tax=Castanea sativa TaxID=21020 RepID=UPI003F64D578